MLLHTGPYNMCNPYIPTCRVRNAREAEILLQVSSTASRFETVVSIYEVLAMKLEALKKGWDSVWLSNEPFLTPSLPLIGEE
jgi:hypothetical protein